MKPPFPKLLFCSVFVIWGLLVVDKPGYMKFASPQQLASLLPKQTTKTLAQPAKNLSCAISDQKLDQKLKQFGIQSCRK